jgi:hypothetical protein
MQDVMETLTLTTVDIAQVFATTKASTQPTSTSTPSYDILTFLSWLPPPFALIY